MLRQIDGGRECRRERLKRRVRGFGRFGEAGAVGGCAEGLRGGGEGGVGFEGCEEGVRGGPGEGEGHVRGPGDRYGDGACGVQEVDALEWIVRVYRDGRILLQPLPRAELPAREVAQRALEERNNPVRAGRGRRVPPGLQCYAPDRRAHVAAAPLDVVQCPPGQTVAVGDGAACDCGVRLYGRGYGCGGCEGFWVRGRAGRYEAYVFGAGGVGRGFGFEGLVCGRGGGCAFSARVLAVFWVGGGVAAANARWGGYEGVGGQVEEGVFVGFPDVLGGGRVGDAARAEGCRVMLGVCRWVGEEEPDSPVCGSLVLGPVLEEGAGEVG